MFIGRGHCRSTVYKFASHFCKLSKLQGHCGGVSSYGHTTTFASLRLVASKCSRIWKQDPEEFLLWTYLHYLQRTLVCSSWFHLDYQKKGKPPRDFQDRSCESRVVLQISENVLCCKMTANTASTDSSRNRTQWFCRWIVVCFMCAHESSYVYSYVCTKESCLDDKLVR